MQSQLTSQEMQAMQRDVQNAMQPYFSLIAKISMMAPRSFILSSDGDMTPETMPEPFASHIEKLRDMAMLVARHIAKCHNFDLESVPK